VASYVREVQYRRKSHKVDIYPEPGMFTVQKGALIAYSGNTGGSLGPHLHFEIRNSANQHPTNVLSYGFDIKDGVAPRFKSVLIYHDQKERIELVRDNGIYTIPWNRKIEAEGEFTLGVEVFDYLDGAANRCGVYTLEAYAGDRLFYRHVMDEFAFSETRYINAHIDYEEKVNSGILAHRLFRLPNNPLRIYSHMEDEGRIPIKEGEELSIKVIAYDVTGNSSELIFTVHGLPVSPVRRKTDDQKIVMRWDEENLYMNDHLSLEIPARALYQNIQFRYSESEKSNGALSQTYHVHSAGTPLHKYYNLAIRAPEVATHLKSKLVIATWDEEEGKHISLGGSYREGMVHAELRQFGDFAVYIDSVAPELFPRNGSVTGDLSARTKIEFIVRDELSGIDSYEGYIDNQWILLEYDPKNDLLSYHFDEKRLEKGKEHELEIYVRDSQGNVNLYHSSFFW
jgi:hypothetical protein